MHRSERGFTLVEVLVALLIMAAIAVMSWRGIDGMLRSRDISQGSLAQTERLQTVLAQWEQDLRSLQDGGGDVSPLSFDGASLRITRQQPGGLQLVAWTVREGRLYRWESATLSTVAALNDALQRSQQGLADQDRQLMALDGVSGWQMFFYRGNAWSNAMSSDDVKQAPPAASGPAGPGRVLPGGVRMILQFAPGSGHGGPLTRQIVLGPQS